MNDLDRPQEEGNPAPRRDFVRLLALGTAGLTVAATTTSTAEAQPRADDPKVEPKPKTDEPAPSEVEGRMEIVLARFGKHKQLDDKARATIKAELAGLVRRSEALRKIPLTNGDGPFPVFHPYRAPLS